MAIITSDLHFSLVFSPLFVFRSILVIRRSTPFPKVRKKRKKPSPRFVSFRLFYTIFEAHFASTERLVAMMCQRANGIK